jgi:hypothetical protein
VKPEVAYINSWRANMAAARKAGRPGRVQDPATDCNPGHFEPGPGRDRVHGAKERCCHRLQGCCPFSESVVHLPKGLDGGSGGV